MARDKKDDSGMASRQTAILQESFLTIDGSVMKILLIDDNADSNDMLGMLLETQGHTVSAASSGRTGMDMARTARPDVVVVDLGLPDIDGLQVIASLMSDHSLSECIVVALTGRNDLESRRQAAAAGARHFFVKGDDISALLAITRH
jgi:DNA-binding response OmpR family regulator